MNTTANIFDLTLKDLVDIAANITERVDEMDTETLAEYAESHAGGAVAAVAYDELSKRGFDHTYPGYGIVMAMMTNDRTRGSLA